MNMKTDRKEVKMNKRDFSPSVDVRGMPRKLRSICLAFTIVLLVVVAASSPVRAEEASGPEQVFPPNLKINGNTYGEWSALWVALFLCDTRW